MHKKINLSILSVAISFLFMLPQIVNAEAFGGKWTVAPTYYMSDSAACSSHVSAAANTWSIYLSSTGSGRQFQKSSVTSASIFTAYAYGQTGWNAMAEVGPNLTSGSYTYGTLKINRTFCDTFSRDKVSAIMVHELGHILGISHTTSEYTSSIMYYGGSSTYFDKWGLMSPTTYDVSTLRTIYR